MDLCMTPQKDRLSMAGGVFYSLPLASSGSRGLPSTLPRLTAVLASLVILAGQRGVRGAGRDVLYGDTNRLCIKVLTDSS